MADPGVVSLDPARLGGLEVYLQGLGDGCRRRAVRVADAVAGSGVGAAQAVAELERLAALCHREADEVRWRRALVEALDHDLPLPPVHFPSTADAVAAAEALAADVHAALRAHPPRWRRLAHLLAELDRPASPRFAADFFRALGPTGARRLPLVLQRAWADSRSSTSDEAAAAVLTAHDRLATALRTASRVRGPHGLDERWCRLYADLPAADDALSAAEGAVTADQSSDAREVEVALRRAGYGLAFAASVSRAVGWQRVAGALMVDRGLVGLVTAPLALADDDGIACDGAEALVRGAAAGVVVLAAAVPGAALPAALAVGVLGGLGVLLDGCERQEPRRGETRPTYDPATGESRLPSGHQSNPNVDIAGVPLPPSYG